MKMEMSKAGAVLLLLLMVSIAIVQPVMAAQTVNDTDSGSGDDGDCACCGEGASGANVSVTELEGAEKNKAIAEALRNEEVKELRGKLIERGFTPKRNDAKSSYRVRVQGIVEEKGIVVDIPFRTGQRDLNASIIWSKDNDGNVDAQAIIGGSAEHFEEALNILYANKTYQRITEELEGEGYSVSKNNITVVELIQESNDTALLAITATNGSESKKILAVVDLIKGEVLYVQDPDWCWIACSTAQAVGWLGCASAVCTAAPPLCGIAVPLCGLVMEEGKDACYDWCQDTF